MSNWLILFRGEQAPSNEAILAALVRRSGVFARDIGGEVVVEDLETKVRLRVTVETGPHVREEAEELSELADTPQAAEEVASCNMRFEIAWPLESSADVTNALCWTAEALGNAVDGPTFIFDPDVSAFV